jgi:antitoxin CptB
MNQTNQMRDVEQRRLIWRCRRGMLELDIVLQRFVNKQFDTLSLDELQVFDEMLELPDNDFWELISSPENPEKNETLNAVVTKLKAVRPNHDQEAD